jgi:hypothetical protein
MRRWVRALRQTLGGRTGRREPPKFPADFRRLIEMEWHRSTRADRPFVVVTVAGPLPVLAHELLAARIRQADACEALEDGGVGILLRDRELETALEWARNLREALAVTGTAPDCGIYPYPPPAAASGVELYPVLMPDPVGQSTPSHR